MPNDHPSVTVAGVVTDLFGHRFVVAVSSGRVLADLGPKGAETVALAVGDQVSFTGEQTPSEVKVRTVTVGARFFELKSDRGEYDHAPEAERAAFDAVKAAGFEPTGPAKHKPKHFEIIGRRSGENVEFHIELDGSIRKRKPLEHGAQEETAS